MTVHAYLDRVAGHIVAGTSASLHDVTVHAYLDRVAGHIAAGVRAPPAFVGRPPVGR